MGELIGQTLAGRYRIESFLGRGGVGEVYKAWDAERGAPVALKVLRDTLAQDPALVRGFRQEARTLAALDHPGIVRFRGFEQDGPLAFLLMDFVAGASLRQWLLNAPGPVAMAEVLGILQPITSALHYAHHMQVVHTDLKPANVLIGPGGEVKLADFGIARLAEAASGEVSGTPAYAAPEQCRGEMVDARTDVYALGVVLFEMVTGGERPFTGRGAAIKGTAGEKVRWEQVNSPPPSPREFNPELPEAIERVILRCLEKEPRKRYPSAMELWAAIDQAAAGTVATVAAPVPVPAAPAAMDDDETPTPVPPADWASAPAPVFSVSAPEWSPPAPASVAVIEARPPAPSRERGLGWVFPVVGLLGIAAMVAVAVWSLGGVAGLMETIAGLSAGAKPVRVTATPGPRSTSTPRPAVTATSRPARTPTPISAANLGPTMTAEWLWDLFFVNNVTWSQRGGRMAWAFHGETLIESRDPYWTWMTMEGGPVQDFMLGADITWESDSTHSAAGCGFVFRLNDGRGDYYVGRLGRDGSAILEVVVKGEGQPALANVPVPGIRTADGATNTLIVTARGPFLTLSVNGEMVIAVEDGTHGVGLAAPLVSNFGGGGTECVFQSGGLWIMPPD